MIWFISDLHHEHDKILLPSYANRPFITIEACSEKITENINKVVQKEDTLIIVGDFCFGNSKAYRYWRSRLICDHVIIIRGNHDKQIPKDCFTLVVDKLEMTVCKQKVLITHYPYRLHGLRRFFYRLIGSYFEQKYFNLRPVNNGDWLICGHDHSTVHVRDKTIKVNVEATDYKPISMKDIERIIQKSMNNKKT